MVKRSRIRYPESMLLKLKGEQKHGIEQIASLTGEPSNEVVRRMIDRQLAPFLAHASTTGKLLNGEPA